MTVLCDKCGCENHLEAESCQECGQPIKTDIEYIVCGTCGLSNPKTASKCVGCSESLESDTSFVLKKDDHDYENAESIISVEASGVVPIPVEAKPKKKKDFSRLIKSMKLGILGILAIALIALIIQLFIGDKVYITAEKGFYYINNTKELHLVDKNNVDTLIMAGIEHVDQVKKFGKNIYFVSDSKLYHFLKDEVTMISDEVNSYSISMTGKSVLYTIGLTDEKNGDLYVYNGRNSVRIDSNVGLNRYVFGSKETDVYYVTDITLEENLGDLYLKSLEKAPILVAEDVFKPLFSSKNETVYFIREAMPEINKFEVFYAANNRVTELARNIKHVIYTPEVDSLLLIQEKNESISLLWSEKETIKHSDREIMTYGMQSFEDIVDPIVVVEDLTLLVKNLKGEVYYRTMENVLDLDIFFEEYYLSDDQSTIVTVSGNELNFASYSKGKLSDSINVATNASFVKMSTSGGLIVVKDQQDNLTLFDDGIEKRLEANDRTIQFSDNERYVVYIDNFDAYALKIGAKEPVYLGENILDLLLVDKYVYTFTSDKLFRYKLGKFSSNKEITTIKTIKILDELY